MVENFYFKQMIAKVSDRKLINLPNRIEISMEISNLTNNINRSIKNSLVKAKYLALTADMWSRPGYKSSLMGITCHFFNRELNRINRALLSCRTLPRPHTGKSIFDDVINDWEIDESKILRIVTDNGPDIVCAFKDCLLELMEEQDPVILAEEHTGPISDADQNLEDTFIDEESEDSAVMEFESSELDMDSYFYRKKRISCFAHNLMLAVSKAVDYSAEVKEAKTKCHGLIAKISKSQKAVEQLRKCTPGGVGLIKPVTTRWIYWFYVFDRILKIERQICDVCRDLKIIHELGPQEWDILSEIRDILSPFAEAVKRLEGESYITISEVYPVIFSLKEKLRQFQRSTRRWSILDVIEKLSSEMNYRFNRMLSPTDRYFDPIYYLATLLDPRYALLLDGVFLDIAKSELKLMIGSSMRLQTSDDSVEFDEIAENVGIPSDETGDLLAVVHAKINEKRRSGSPVTTLNPVDRELEFILGN